MSLKHVLDVYFVFTLLEILWHEIVTVREEENKRIRLKCKCFFQNITFVRNCFSSSVLDYHVEFSTCNQSQCWQNKLKIQLMHFCSSSYNGNPGQTSALCITKILTGIFDHFFNPCHLKKWKSVESVFDFLFFSLSHSGNLWAFTVLK